jgi:hypothetical protein
MTSKILEIRDKGTFIPILATKLNPDDEAERYLLARAGYGRTPEAQSEYVLVSQILGGGTQRCTTDPYGWPGGERTYQVAHDYIRKNFDRLVSGDVVCVEFLLGERTTPKVSESRIGVPA